ncbi:MAG: DUF4386 domain-containing protein [Candidatus Palauibacterales bacterium]|nr:DUF4386 domain-containing protein [Candidatus Palauibacterales bacterium]MDP2584976.1 DUF4386 domain-containing protein [Candidatus Palauibacterales bacterium]
MSAFRSVEAAPKLYARTGGALYLAIIALGAVAEAVRGRVVVPGDPAATAAHLTSAQALWRLGIGAELAGLVFTVVLAMVFYVLFRPVSREVNLLATFLRLAGITVQAVAVTSLVAALAPLAGPGVAGAFSATQRSALVGLAVDAHQQDFGLALLLFGVCFQFHGWLIYRSSFLPRTLGVLIVVAGLCYITNSLALFLAPALQDRLYPLILLPPFVGELSLCLWLLVKGVDAQRWTERWRAARSGPGAA